MAKKLPIWDERMIMLMNHLISSGQCETQKEFFDIIGFRQTSLSQVKQGLHSFRHQHLLIASKKYNVNLNWFYGLESNMIREGKKSHSPVQKMQEAMTEITALLNG